MQYLSPHTYGVKTPHPRIALQLLTHSRRHTPVSSGSVTGATGSVPPRGERERERGMIRYNSTGKQDKECSPGAMLGGLTKTTADVMLRYHNPSP